MPRINRSGRLLLMGVLIGLGFSSRFFAQVNASRVEGIVTDPQGLPVPGVELKLMETRMGLQRMADSSSAGAYEFPSLGPGADELSGRGQGFAPAVKRRTLGVNQTLRRDLSPQMWTTSQS